MSDVAGEGAPATRLIAAGFQALPFSEPATGLVYARARWYDPRTGSFLNPDPLGYVDSSNLYAFCGSDPVNGTDPRGEAGRVGGIYRLEGYIGDEPIVYTGSAASIKKRLTKRHKYGEIISDPRTRIYEKETMAELDIASSNRGTFRGARSEALRAAEQFEIDEAERIVEARNRSLAEGESPVRVANAVKASTEPEVLAARHQVTTSREWKLIKGAGSTALNTTFGFAMVFDAYQLAREQRESRYTFVPYVLKDTHGSFKIEARMEWLFFPAYQKHYIAGPAQGKVIEISPDEAKKLREEAEALWGTTDWTGDFVPGLLRPTLPPPSPVVY